MQGRIKQSNMKSSSFSLASLTQTLHTHSDPMLLVFHMEDALLKSSSVFPYFMLVAFEGGGPLRALCLLLLYPLILFLGEGPGLTLMVFVCFAGLKQDSFRLGSSVLHKFLLEDMGTPGFERVMRFKRRIAVSEMPTVMILGFLRDYIGVENVLGRDLEAVNGYFSGFMKARNNDLDKNLIANSHAVAVGCFGNHHHHQVVSMCKEIYTMSEAEKARWETVPRDRYPKPLIFHDGRLAFRPTPLDSLILFMWLPVGLVLSLFRLAGAIILPYKIYVLFSAMTGMITTEANSVSLETHGSKGVLYVCNHRTLLDPIYVSGILLKPMTAVTYGISRLHEVISYIKTVRLTRDREKDKLAMETHLRGSALMVCPEGTTCREPYLLRFSPLFAEVSKDIVPVAVSTEVGVFYGSTASGLKALDLIFHLMNPRPIYTVKFLEKLTEKEIAGRSKFEVANHVQRKIADALGFECTDLTRKRKYMILAGTDGTI